MADTQTQRSPHQSRVFLKNGNGTVAAEDYDEAVHGKALDLTDEEYDARLAGRFSGIPAAPSFPKTTIANLQTFDPATQSAAVAPPPPPVVPAVPPVGQPVATLTAAEADAQRLNDQAARHQADADKAQGEADRAAKVKQQADDAAARARQSADEAAAKSAQASTRPKK